MEPQDRNYRAIIFDMDGLMLDTERMARRAWLRTAQELGYTMAEGLFEQLLGRNSRDDEQILKNALGESFPVQKAFSLRIRYMTEEIENYGIPLKEGLLELLDFLEAAGVPVAVATSTSRDRAIFKLEKTGLKDRFNIIVAGDQIKEGKPHPEIFLRTAAEMRMPPELCVVLEDSEAGIRAAHAAGMLPIIVPDVKQPSEEIRNLVFRECSSLYDVLALLPQMLSDEFVLPQVSGAHQRPAISDKTRSN